jgi:hypothetical protein
MSLPERERAGFFIQSVFRIPFPFVLTTTWASLQGETELKNILENVVTKLFSQILRVQQQRGRGSID